MVIDASTTVTVLGSASWDSTNVTDIVAGELNGFTYAGSKLTATNAGTYLVSWAYSGIADSGTPTVISGISIDGATPAAGHKSARKYSNTSDVGAVAGSNIITLTAGQTLELRHYTSGGNDIEVTYLNFNVTQL